MNFAPVSSMLNPCYARSAFGNGFGEAALAFLGRASAIRLAGRVRR
jgi:hypothetical protein